MLVKYMAKYSNDDLFPKSTNLTEGYGCPPIHPSARLLTIELVVCLLHFCIEPLSQDFKTSSNIKYSIFNISP